MADPARRGGRYGNRRAFQEQELGFRTHETRSLRSGRVRTPAAIPWVQDPIEPVTPVCYLSPMNMLLLILVLILLFGGGGLYLGGPAIGGVSVRFILLVCLVIYFLGGFRVRN